MRTVLAKLLVPVLQVLVGNLPICVEYKYAHVRAIVVSWMQLIKRLLSCSVPNVYRIKLSCAYLFSRLFLLSRRRIDTWSERVSKMCVLRSHQAEIALST